MGQLQRAIRIAAELDAASGPEYLRGISELLAGMFPDGTEDQSLAIAEAIKNHL